MAQRQDEDSQSTTASVRVGAVAVLLVLVVVAARARAAGLTPPHVPGPSGNFVMGVIQVFGTAVLTAGMVLLLWGRWVRRNTETVTVKKRKRAPLGLEDRKRVIIAAGVGMAVALLLQFLGSFREPVREEPPPSAPDAPMRPPAASDLGLGNLQQAQDHSTSMTTYVTSAVLLAVLAAVVFAVLGRDRVEVVEEDDELDPEQVAQAVAAAHAAVRDRTITDPRQAIVACFAAMERALAARGADHAPRLADTPEEVLQRGRGLLPDEPAGTLLRLFREARFSTHPMHEADREAADGALTRILAALGVEEGSR